MKNLNLYVTEKLRLNKDIVIKNTLNIGDSICFMDIKCPGISTRNGSPIEVCIHDPFEIDDIDIDKKEIKYVTDTGKSLKFIYNYINRYGFPEENNNYNITIILNTDETISLLTELYKSKKRITLDTLKNKYSEKVDSLKNMEYWNNEIRYTAIKNSYIIDLNRKIIDELISELTQP